MSKNEFELLAPAGSFETFQAVIEAGADAIYIGGNLFGARAYADNFSGEELQQALDYAHIRGRKVYLTVNTLLKNEEIKNTLYHYLLPLYESGLDAVLVQDMGALDFIRRAFPKLPIHASTQMTVTGVEGVKFLQSLGVSRVVMAREVSLEEMRRIHRETGMELEAFVHGALCYCYSGQCLFSSMLGGRSGNRGRCAQPCRLSYSVLEQNRKKSAEDCYILSLKDMCGIEDIPALHQAGVYSLKIEGRMKQTSYAAGIVSFYRKYIDRYLSFKEEKIKISKEDRQAIMDLGNRCGFTDAYYKKHNGRDMVTFSKPNYTRGNAQLQQHIFGLYTGESSGIPVLGHGIFRKGEPASLEVTYQGGDGKRNFIVPAENCPDKREESIRMRAVGQVVDTALKSPVSEEELTKRLCKTGDTPFVFSELTLETEPDIFLPNGSINQLRRDALEGLRIQLLKKYHRDSCGCHEPELRKIPEKLLPENSRLIADVSNREQLEAVLDGDGITDIYLETISYSKNHFILELSRDIQMIEDSGRDISVYLALPVIFRNATYDFYKSLAENIKKLPIKGFLIRNYEELGWVKREFAEYEMILDHNMYTYNDYAVSAFAECCGARNTVPLELNRREIIYRENSYSEMIVYGYYPLMTSAQCIHKNTAGCNRNSVTTYLKDRYQVEFPAVNYCNECFNMIYNSLPTMLISEMSELKKAGISDFRLNFTIERKAEVERIWNLLTSSGEEQKRKMTKGHYKRGVE